MFEDEAKVEDDVTLEVVDDVPPDVVDVASFELNSMGFRLSTPPSNALPHC